MIEHRLIERLLAVVQARLPLIEQSGELDPLFVDTVVDFIRTYADRTHHGKEEDILFRVLAKKPMSERDRRTMDELVEEHKYARGVVRQLVQAKQEYVAGQKTAVATVVGHLKTLVRFYPEHIRKEDQDFFVNSESYLSEAEQQAMLDEFWEFDRKMIHEKYKSIVAALSQ